MMFSIEQALQRCGVAAQIQHLDSSTRSVADAARTIGCAEGQIGKSIIFRGLQSRQAILVVACGTNRVDEQRLAAAAGEEVELAGADFVRQETGYVIGGVPPIGHRQPIRTFLDTDLLQFEQVFVAAGTPRSIIQLSRKQLLDLLPDAIQTAVT